MTPTENTPDPMPTTKPGAAKPDNAGVRIPAPVIFAIAVLPVLWIGRHVDLPAIPLLSERLRTLSGMFLIVAGGAIALTAAGLFRNARTALLPFRPASALVTDGVFRWTRNPIYLAMALASAGLALTADNLLALVLVAPAMWAVGHWVIAREEAYLDRRFGADYRAYKERTRRWM